MGQTVVNIVNEKEGCEIVAGVDTRGDAKNGFPVFSNINDCNVEDLEWLGDLEPDEAVTQEDIRYVETD